MSQEPGTDEEQILVPKQLLIDFQGHIDELPLRLREPVEQVRDNVTEAVTAIATRIGETAEETINALVEAIPAVIARHAPETSPEVLQAITKEIEQHAIARLDTLKAARDPLKQSSDTSS